MIYLTDAYRNIFEILKKSKQLTFQLPFFFFLMNNKILYLCYMEGNLQLYEKCSHD